MQNTGFVSKFANPPWVGLIAFLCVFVVQMLGHIVMIVMEKLPFMRKHDYWYSQFNQTPNQMPAGAENFAGLESVIYLPAIVMGIVGLIIILWGVAKNTEIAGSWAGFVGASLMWTGWVEFSLHFHARYFGVKALCEDGQYAYACADGAATKPEYFLMQGSVGFLLVAMLYFTRNKESRCNMFRWMHKHLRIKVGKPSRSLTRNFANIVAIETFMILWFFYVFLMILYDPVFFGEQHWFTYVCFVGFGLWSLYLIQRLLRFKRMPSALRYAIPTAIITYNMVEIGGRWSWYKEFWVHPFEYPIAAVLVGIATVAFAVISIKAATNKN